MSTVTRTVKCTQCGKEFDTPHNNPKYCSKECLSNAKYERERAKLLSERRRNGFVGKDVRCLVCGKMFTQASRNEKCCSRTCAKALFSIEHNGATDGRGKKPSTVVVEKPWKGNVIEILGVKYSKEGLSNSSKGYLEDCKEVGIKPHLCADCKKEYTPNHRCPKCLDKFRRKHLSPRDFECIDIIAYNVHL